MAIPVELLITAGSLIGAGGAAWGGAMVALNGTRKRVQAIDEKFDLHVAHDAQVQVDLVDRASRTEAKIDLVLQRLQ